jgi:predicted RNA binding protein YcfA (HicA-like mRNA interferase family)
MICVSGSELVSALKRAGFEEVSQKGSHLKMRAEAFTVIVPMHKEIAPGTLRSILKQAGMSEAQLKELL